MRRGSEAEVGSTQDSQGLAVPGSRGSVVVCRKQMVEMKRYDPPVGSAMMGKGKTDRELEIWSVRAK